MNYRHYCCAKYYFQLMGKISGSLCFIGWGQKSTPAIFRQLQSPPVFDILHNNQLDLSGLGIEQTTIDAI